VPFLSQPTHFVTRVDLDIFVGIAWFSQNKHYFVAYDKLFLEKITKDSIFPIQVPYGETYSFIAMKKT
jgi:hypothetical protein